MHPAAPILTSSSTVPLAAIPIVSVLALVGDFAITSTALGLYHTHARRYVARPGGADSLCPLVP